MAHRVFILFFKPIENMKVIAKHMVKYRFPVFINDVQYEIRTRSVYGYDVLNLLCPDDELAFKKYTIKYKAKKTSGKLNWDECIKTEKNMSFVCEKEK